MNESVTKRLDVQQLKEKFRTFAPFGLIWVYLIVAAVFYMLAATYIPTQNGDTVEHIHSAFLVSIGQVPYRDFFQHHNPLLWYLFAPLVYLFAYNATITEIVSVISFLVFLKSLVYVYRIASEFLTTKLWGLMSAAAVITPFFKLYAVDFRPDNYMIFCLMGGLYYYFCYLRDKRCRQLVITFVWFCLSFLFAQKAIFPLAVIGLSGLYFWYKKEIKTSDMLKALMVPTVIGAGFLMYLYHYGMIELYYRSNFTFNLNLAAGFELNRVVAFPLVTKILTVMGFFGAIMSLFSHNRYLSLLSLLFVSEFCQRFFYFSPYSYYYWLMMYLAALCGMPFLARIDSKVRVLSAVVVAGFFWLLYHAVLFYVELAKVAENRPYLPDYIARQITPCDYVFNGDGMMYNLFGKDPAYYWQLIGQLDVIGEETGISPRPNLNELILRLKPRFVFGNSYLNKLSNESGRPEVVHYIDKDILNTYYMPTTFSAVYQLKPEYRMPCAIEKSGLGRP